jgi:hypothetical protein
VHQGKLGSKGFVGVVLDRVASTLMFACRGEYNRLVMILGCFMPGGEKAQEIRSRSVRFWRTVYKICSILMVRYLSILV